MKAVIRKIKNFAGYEYTCSDCGRTIKHAFYIDGKIGVFGSECVKKHLPGRLTEKQIKDQIDLHKRLAHILNNKATYSWKEYRDCRQWSDEQLENHFLETGKLG